MMLIPLFFIISIIYSAVGLGGGSAYIAAMVLFDTPKDILPITALGCNLIVAATGFIRYRHAGFFRWNIFWPFAATSIPFAYIGGRLHVSDMVFVIIMAAALFFAAIRLVFWTPLDKYRTLKGTSPLLSVGHLAIGAVLGFLAGITGIGGGIYLIPILILLKIASPKEASACASLFIVVNSASGLLGQISKASPDWRIFLPLALAVLAGGAIGSNIGATKLKGEVIQKIVGVILLIAAAKLFF
jgi:uncharacterized membrane protein YfcA